MFLFVLHSKQSIILRYVLQKPTHILPNAYCLTSSLTKGQRESLIEVSISGKSMVGFEGLWAHDNFWIFFGPEVSFENYLKIRF